MQDQIDYKVTEHVLGLADPPVANQHNIKALACVFFRSLRDISGQLQEKQGANVPVVHITDLVVGSPNPRFLMGWEDDLIRGIVAWAKHMDKFVTVMPADEETEEYYKSLGFQRFESLPFVMVYQGKKEKDVEDTPSRGLLLDLHFESRRQNFVWLLVCPYLKLILKAAPIFLIICWFKAVAGAWCTTVRMHNVCRWQRIFGCPDAEDEFSHYMECLLCGSLLERH